MRHIPRHLFTLCSTVSLLLCVAACGLWATCGYDIRASPERCPECGAKGAG